MRAAGLDIGSRTVKLAVLEEGKTTHTRKALTSHDPLEAVRELAKGVDYDVLVATGYGRVLVPFANENVSEISCHARGVNHCFPSVRTILDMGGQDCKAIALENDGRLKNFAMNDKYAGGTVFFDFVTNADGTTTGTGYSAGE